MHRDSMSRMNLEARKNTCHINDNRFAIKMMAQNHLVLGYHFSYASHMATEQISAAALTCMIPKLHTLGVVVKQFSSGQTNFRYSHKQMAQASIL